MQYISDIEISDYNKSLDLTVEYEYSFDPGMERFENGDPGYSENDDFYIVSITCSEVKNIEKTFNRMDQMNEGKVNYVSPWELVKDQIFQVH